MEINTIRGKISRRAAMTPYSTRTHSNDTAGHSGNAAAPHSRAALSDTFSMREIDKDDAAVMLYTPAGTLSDTSTEKHSVLDTLSDTSTEKHSAVKTMAERKTRRFTEQLEKMIQQKKAADLAAQEYKSRMEEAKRYTELLAEEAKNRRIALEIYRRIARGGKVPPQDERWLMEYSPQMYFSAKMQALQAEEDKKYDSALENDEKSDEIVDTGAGTFPGATDADTTASGDTMRSHTAP